MNNVFIFFSNFFALTAGFQIFQQLFLLSTAVLKIFSATFCFQLFSDFSATFLISTAGFHIF